MRLPPGPQDHLVFDTLVGSLESASAAARPFSSPHQVPFSPHVAKTLLMFTSPSGSPSLCAPGAGSPPLQGCGQDRLSGGSWGLGQPQGWQSYLPQESCLLAPLDCTPRYPTRLWRALQGNPKPMHSRPGASVSFHCAWPPGATPLLTLLQPCFQQAALTVTGLHVTSDLDPLLSALPWAGVQG